MTELMKKKEQFEEAVRSTLGGKRASEVEMRDTLLDLSKQIVWVVPAARNHNRLLRTQVVGGCIHSNVESFMMFECHAGRYESGGEISYSQSLAEEVLKHGGSYYFDPDTKKLFGSKIHEHIHIRGTGVVLLWESIRGPRRDSNRWVKIMQPYFARSSGEVEGLIKWECGSTRQKMRQAERVFTALRRVLKHEAFAHTPELLEQEAKLAHRVSAEIISKIPEGLY